MNERKPVSVAFQLHVLGLKPSYEAKTQTPAELGADAIAIIVWGREAREVGIQRPRFEPACTGVLRDARAVWGGCKPSTFAVGTDSKSN